MTSLHTTIEAFAADIAPFIHDLVRASQPASLATAQSRHCHAFFCQNLIRATPWWNA
jgi:hypothetical protein